MSLLGEERHLGRKPVFAHLLVELEALRQSEAYVTKTLESQTDNMIVVHTDQIVPSGQNQPLLFLPDLLVLFEGFLRGFRRMCKQLCVYVCVCVHVCIHICVCIGGCECAYIYVYA